MEIYKARTQSIQENLKRLQLKATVITADGNNPSAWWDQKPFDRILLDAPCSASGVIRRHPDIKYLRKPIDIPQLHQQQLQLLKALWPLLKPGGLLVYTTCSFFPEENVQTIDSFLSQHNARCRPLSIPIGLTQSIGHQLLPEKNGMDGFYYARLEKKC